jgi:hypothetical protein
VLSGGTCELLSALSVLLAAVSVKLLDDTIDIGSEDSSTQARPVYAMLLLWAASVLDIQLAGALFAASYVTGMVSRPLADGRGALPVITESGAVLVFSVLALGYCRVLSALALALAVQLADDAMDHKADMLRGATGLATRFGRVECSLAAPAFWLIALHLDVRVAGYGALGAAGVWAGEFLYPLCVRRRKGA